MSTWSATSDVQARLAYAETFGAGTAPTSNAVQAWLNDAENMISASLLAAGIASPAAGAAGTGYLKRYAVDYAAANVRMSKASANGGGLIDDTAQKMLDGFDAFLNDIVARSAHWSEILESASPGIDSLHFKGTATADLGGRAVTAAGMAPVFTRTTEI